MCAGLEDVIEGATHAVGQRRLERVQARRDGTEEGSTDEAEEDEEAEEEEVVVGLTNLTIETVGTEEEAAAGLEAALEMESVEGEGREGEEGGGGIQRALGAIELLTQEAEQRGTTFVDARNGFNELSRLAMLWTVQHR